MKITVNNIEREVNVYKKNQTWLAFVGTAKVYWKPYYKRPYVIIPNQNKEVVAKYTPMILEFLKEYKRIVSKPKKTPPLSFEGEVKPNSVYKFNPAENDSEYVSGVPKWLRDVKIKQVCSGPVRTFTRGIQIPQEYKQLALKYAPYCCNCVHRINCDAPCLTPDINSQEELLKGVC